MTRQEILEEILREKIVAIIRLDRSDDVNSVATALVKGGVKTIEVTMGTPNALAEIKKMAQNPNILPGVGSVINAEMAEKAILAGAEFVVTPISKLEIIEMAHKYGKPVMSGAFTPKEVLQAFEWGADVIKLFPAGAMGLPYFKAIKAPMPQIPIMPTGGVTVENAAEWIRNGAVALGVGGTLVNKTLISGGDFEAITDLARKMKNELLAL